VLEPVISLHIKFFWTLMSLAVNNKVSVSAVFCQQKGNISIRLIT